MHIIALLHCFHSYARQSKSRRYIFQLAFNWRWFLSSNYKLLVSCLNDSREIKQLNDINRIKAIPEIYFKKLNIFQWTYHIAYRSYQMKIFNFFYICSLPDLTVFSMWTQKLFAGGGEKTHSQSHSATTTMRWSCSIAYHNTKWEFY